MKWLLIPVCLIFMVGCTNYTLPPEPQAQNNLTAGTVQRSIHKGMTQAEVLQVMGSPNLATRDKNGVETWAWDRSSSDIQQVSNSSTGYGTVLLVGGSSSSGATHTRTSQKTLTVIIKFIDGLVSDFSYNQTSF